MPVPARRTLWSPFLTGLGFPKGPAWTERKREQSRGRTAEGIPFGRSSFVLHDASGEVARGSHFRNKGGDTKRRGREILSAWPAADQLPGEGGASGDSVRTSLSDKSYNGSNTPYCGGGPAAQGAGAPQQSSAIYLWWGGAARSEQGWRRPLDPRTRRRQSTINLLFQQPRPTNGNQNRIGDDELVSYVRGTRFPSPSDSEHRTVRVTDYTSKQETSRSKWIGFAARIDRALQPRCSCRLVRPHNET